MEVDYLVVGSGLTGATIARLLSDNGEDVAILERRSHIGGNVHDYVHESGVRIHSYGPHYFRTSSDRIWNFVNRFAPFYKYEAIVMSEVCGKLEYWPIHAESIKRLAGVGWRPGYSGQDAANFEDQCLSVMPLTIYRLFIHGYTVKQWGVAPSQLGPHLAKRFDVRTDGDCRLKRSTYQGIPTGGYAKFMENLVRGLRVYCNVDFLKERGQFSVRKLIIYTGAIDEYFAFDIGKLAYRSQHRTHTYFKRAALKQAVPQVNYPDMNIAVIRTLEWKHMMEPQLQGKIQGTVLTAETPYSPSDPREYEYPFPDSYNQSLFSRYRERADKEEKLLICGRLGEYRYFDMDQAIARAIKLANRIMQGATKGQLISWG